MAGAFDGFNVNESLPLLNTSRNECKVIRHLKKKLKDHRNILTFEFAVTVPNDVRNGRRKSSGEATGRSPELSHSLRGIADVQALQTLISSIVT